MVGLSMAERVEKDIDWGIDLDTDLGIDWDTDSDTHLLGMEVGW